MARHGLTMTARRGHLTQAQAGFSGCSTSRAQAVAAIARVDSRGRATEMETMRRAESRLAVMVVALLLVLPAAAQPARPRPGRPKPPTMSLVPSESTDVLSPWERMKVLPGETLVGRPPVPEEGRSNCVRVERIAGAQLHGDVAIDLTMSNGRQWRLFLANECPGLSFYQGFYYRRGKAGMLCAGRDSIGARSGGECRIASILPLPQP
jgi:hypothetical protein